MEENFVYYSPVGNGTDVTIAKYCGGESLPEAFISTTNTVRLRFHAGGSPDNLGFRMEYKSVRKSHKGRCLQGSFSFLGKFCIKEFFFFK